MVGETTFVYPQMHTLSVYRNGEVLSLKKAFEAGWLTQESVTQIHADYQAYKQAEQGA